MTTRQLIRASQLMKVRLRLSEFGHGHTTDEILREFLDEAERLTESKVGFFHFVEEDQVTLTLQMWSTNTLENMCTAEGKDQHYNLDLAGVWVDCVRERKPVIHNDYASLPYRKGMPDGHAPIARELVVPVFRGEKIMAILGVGNKDTDYTQEDVNTMVALTDQAWDIVERRRAEDKLEKERMNLRKAQEIAKCGNWDWDLITGDIQWSAEMYRIYGVPDDTRPTAELVRELVVDSDKAAFDQAFESLRTGKGDAPEFAEYRVRRHDGRTIFVFSRVDPIKDDTGKVRRLFGTTQDITDRKQAENALRKSEEKFRRYISSAPTGIFVFGGDGRLVEVNLAATRLTGYGDAELLQMSAADLSGALQEQCDIVRLPGEPVSAEIAIRRKDGPTICASLDGVRISEDTFMAFCTDISETKRLRELEARAQRLETAGQIAGQVAHDFNNLLAPLMAYPEFIRDKLPENHRCLPLLKDIEIAAQRIAGINEQLLTLGRRGHYTVDQLDLPEIVRDALKDIKYATTLPPCEIDYGEDVKPVRGGRGQIYRVISNLLHNAIDAVRDGGSIAIKTENWRVDDSAESSTAIPSGNYVRLTVSDTGCGIPPDVVEHILDPFFTTKTTDKKRGSGLGLSVVDAVVKDHHGYLEMETEVGKGTSFVVSLPAAQAIAKKADPCERAGGTESILIVDDDGLQRDVTIRLLGALGYTATAVESGEKAIELMRRVKYDLLILDMVIPGGMDGTETYRKASEINPGQKAIILSGFSESDRVLEARKLGAGTFVKKPVNRQSLGAALRRELARVPLASQ